MKLYIVRSLKYIVKMAVVIGAALFIMHLTGTLNVPGEDIMKTLFLSRNGMLLVGLLLLLALSYPKLSFAKVEVRAEMGANRKAIVEAFAAYGYAPVKEDGGMMVFRAESVAKRLLNQWDDAVTVTATDGGHIELEGLKKVVGRVESRLSYILGQ